MSETKTTSVFQWDKTDLDGYMLIEASAGTGKTFSLIHAVMRLVFEKKIALNRILVVTFTKAAAAELRARIRALLMTVVEAMRRSDLTLIDGEFGELCRRWNREGLLTQARVDEAIESFDECQVSTIHGFCQQMLAENEFSASQGFGYEIGDDSTIKSELIENFLRKRLAQFGDSDDQKALLSNNANWAGKLDALQMMPVGAQVRVIDYQLEKTDKKSKKVQRVALSKAVTQTLQDFIDTMPDALAQAKRQARIRTFNDILTDMQKELQNDPFVQNVRKRFDAVLIDEFQDTDPVQYDIFRTLFLPPQGQSSAGYPQSVIFVGDPKQSIYEFRNADLNTYLQARKELNNTYRLESNYRSTPPLVSVFNSFFINEAQPGSAFFTEEILYDVVQSGAKCLPLLQKDAEGYSPLPVFEVLRSDDQSYFKKIEEVRDCEARWVCADIKRLLGHEVYVDADKKIRLRANHIALLVRSYKDADRVAAELNREGIRVRYENNGDVFKSEEAAEILAIMQAMHSPDDLKLMRFARSTRIVGERLNTIAGDALKTLDKGDSADQADRCAAQSRETLTEAAAIVSSQGIAAAFALILRTFKTEERLLLEQGGERRLTNYHHIIELLQQQAHSLKTLAGLTRWYEREMKSDAAPEERNLRVESDADLVTVVSIHKSKGLEYPVVYLVGAYNQMKSDKSDNIIKVPENGQTTLYLSHEPIDKTESGLFKAPDEAQLEQYRLAYVALTRASQRVVLPLMQTFKGKNWIFNTRRSPYLRILTREMDPNCQSADQALKNLQERIFGRLNDLDSTFFDRLQSICGHPVLPSELFRIQYDRELDFSAPEVESFNEDEIDISSAEASARKADWVNSSFTSITRMVNESRLEDLQPDNELIVEEIASASSEEIHDRLPKGLLKIAGGTEFGLCMHELFEKVDFDLAHQAAAGDKAAYAKLNDFVKDITRPYKVMLEKSCAFDEAGQLFVQMLIGTLTTPITVGKESAGQETFRLCDIAKDQRLAEMPFVMPIGAPKQGRDIASAANLEKVLDAFGEPYAVPTLLDKDLKGYLVGFIDLAFQDQNGRYWVLDWKSNRSGVYQAEDYTEEYVASQMREHHYTLQYLLYLVALRRYLKSRGLNADIAGAVYVFVRGVSSDHPGRGLWVDEVNPLLIECLDDFFKNGFSQEKVNEFLRCAKEKSDAI